MAGRASLRTSRRRAEGPEAWRPRRRTRRERLTKYERYWDKPRETMDPGRRERLILERLQQQLRYVYERLPFYRRHYDAHGLEPSTVSSLEDFTRKVPVVTKQMLVDDQAEHPPFGSYLGADRSALARVQGSSGTTGVPTMYGVSTEDWQRGSEMMAMGLWCCGVRPDDVVQILFPFGLFFGGWGVLQGVERIGACAFPIGASVSSERQIELIRKLGTDVLIGTPSYIAHLGKQAAEIGVDTASTAVSLAMVAGEPGGSIPSVRRHISELWAGIDIVDAGPGVTSELYPFCSSTGCLEAEGGVHLYIDENYTEIVSKEDPNAPVPVGTSGAAVSTHLWRKSQPMIRLWTGDEAVLDDAPCPCGRTYPRLPKGVKGRLDDMLVIRGANVYPSAVEGVVREVEAAGAEYRIIVDRPAEMDEMTLQVEPSPNLPSAKWEGLRTEMEERLKRTLGLRIPVEVVEPGTHELQTFKAHRVIDRRRLG